MTEIQAIVLGIVQGLTEFLPISSSGHLIIVPLIFGWDLQDLSFDVALHFGTTLAVLIYYRKLWLKLITNFKIDTIDKKILPINTKSIQRLSKDSQFLITIIVVSIPVGIVGVFFENYLEKILRSPLSVAVVMLIVSFVMFLADRHADKNEKKNIKSEDATYNALEKEKNLESTTTFKNALIVSLSQILALIPGTSRSGITISTGIFRNISRENAAQLSFMLATPIIFGATLFSLKDLVNSDLDASVLLAGVFSSFIAGFIAISFLMKFLKTHKLTIFIVYRVLVASLIIYVILSS